MLKSKSIPILELNNDLEVQFVRFDNPQEMSGFIFEKFVQTSNDIILPGGKSILPLYDFLNARPEAMRNKNFYLCDERMDGAKSVSSNQNNLMVNYTELGKRTIGFNDLNYEEKIRGLYDKSFISVLGVGEDGHIASLFPEDPYFRNDDLFHTFKKSNEDYTRASLSFNLLLNSTELIFWICGSSKRVLLEMLQKKDQTKPFVNLIIEFNKLQLKPIIVCDKEFLPNESY